MKSLYEFIVKPFNERYNNNKKIGDKTLILNTKIENHLFVSKKAVVCSVPAAFSTPIKVGDEVYIHHNIFRKWHDQKGRIRNSAKYFKENMYFANPQDIYMYNNTAHLNYCFVKPILNKDILKNQKEQPNVGIIKYTNNALEAIGITPGTLITFTPNSEFEFVINDERLYCMKSNYIALVNEYEGNEKENNPSWAKSG